MACPYLDYRESSDDDSFETARAYCTVGMISPADITAHLS